MKTTKTYNEWIEDIHRTWARWKTQDRIPSVLNDLAPRSRAKKRQTLDERAVRLVWKFWDTKALTYREVNLRIRRRETATENIELLARALDMIRLAEVRGLTDVIVPLYRQMYPLPAPEVPRASTSPHIPMHYAALHVAADAPIEVCEAAYRALAKRHHPDAGGDPEIMRTLNAAIERIRQEASR